MQVFWNWQALLIIIPGTAFISLAMFGRKETHALLEFSWNLLFHHRDVNFTRVIQELVNFSMAYRSEVEDFEKRVWSLRDPFLKDSLAILIEGILDPKTMSRVLKSRVQTHSRKLEDNVTRLRILAKVTTALGFFAAMIVMVEFFNQISGSVDRSQMGSTLASSVMATIYGVVISQFFFAPLIQRAENRTRQLRLRSVLISQTILLMVQKTNPIVIAEELNSYVDAHQRLEWAFVQDEIKKIAA